ncbi:hypothetical protein MA04_02919 [Alcanivorax balearicus MACL04]|uniref:DUF1513 domain-containing protein n=1 Tax=Alloalcanivorax balearicus MACL04 TaxID=1177182 RepID=A0ABT2R1I9_9GAMM|nr:hypothetical protein [Alloalcanivorax balearicus]MCU5783619.1 hypothetical protein [Alloalcanivorax balearicus MACL04]
MELTRRQFLVAGSGITGVLMTSPLSAATAGTGVEMIHGALALALPGGERVLVRDFGREVHWQRADGLHRLDLGSPFETRVVAAARDQRTLWLLDRHKRLLHGVNERGTVQHQLSLPTLREPADMVIHQGQAFISDVSGHRIVRLDLHEGSMSELHSDRPLNGPSSLAIGRSGLSALTLGDHRLHHFTANGESLGSQTSPVATPAALSNVNGALLLLDRCRNQLCWAGHARPALALPSAGPARLGHISWQPGGDLLVSL